MSCAYHHYLYFFYFEIVPSNILIELISFQNTIKFEKIFLLKILKSIDRTD